MVTRSGRTCSCQEANASCNLPAERHVVVSYNDGPPPDMFFSSEKRATGASAAGIVFLLLGETSWLIAGYDFSLSCFNFFSRSRITGFSSLGRSGYWNSFDRVDEAWGRRSRLHVELANTRFLLASIPGKQATGAYSSLAGVTRWACILNYKLTCHCVAWVGMTSWWRM